MSASESPLFEPSEKWPRTTEKPQHFRRLIVRGLSVVLPPLLTIAILVWVAGIVNQYVLVPAHATAQFFAVKTVADIRTENIQLTSVDSPEFPELPNWKKKYRLDIQWFEKYAENKADLVQILTELKSLLSGTHGVPLQNILDTHGDYVFVPIGTEYIPLAVYQQVVNSLGRDQIGSTATQVYQQHVSHSPFLFGSKILSLGNIGSLFVLILLILGTYFLGHILALRLGRAVWQSLEYRMIFRVPLVRNVYSSVKQVTDFILTERKIEYNRVVAIQYPRNGIWSLGFVTGKSMLSIEKATGEPMVSVLIPTSPLPMTGYTVNLRRSELIDLNISIDQAIQFCISCGVVVPPGELPDFSDTINSSEKLITETPPTPEDSDAK